MKKCNSILAILLVLCLLAGCGLEIIPETTQTVATTTPSTTAATVPTTVPATVPATQPTAPAPSELYIPGLEVEDVIRYFNEVCLNAEFINSGDPTKLQKWTNTIFYIVNGTCTEKDTQVMEDFFAWLNSVEGFPGIKPIDNPNLADLSIHFCNETDYIALMGSDFYATDGGVTFWYNNANQIYDATIGYRTDIDQEIRNSVILEEIYNGLGPMNDTSLRTDSIIYSEYSTPQSLTAIDELILRLLYHPQMECGMDAAACEAVIRQLYY